MKQISLFLSLLLTLTHSYRISKIDKSSGLFFRNLGKAQLSNQKYILVTFTNLTHIKEQVTISNEQYDKASYLCTKISTQYLRSDCENQLQLIGIKMRSIKNDYAIISHQLSSIRKKRGLINLGGQILHWLFGTLDSNDAEYYSGAINSLINDRKETHSLMQQQISIISSTITNFNESVRRINTDAYFLNKNLQQLENFITQTTDNERRLDYEI